MGISTAQQVRRQAESVWSRSHARLIAAALTCLGAGLRFYNVNANGLRLDETWSVWMARQDVVDMVRSVLFYHVDATPPSYYTLLHFFLLLGDHLLAIRALSILAGAVIVWLTFQLAAYLFDLRVAALSAFLIAIAPLHIEYSQVARSYMLADLWALVSLYCCARLLFEPPRRRYWIGLVLASVAAFYTFYLMLLVLLFENILVVIFWLRRRLSRSLFIKWLISQAVIGIILLPTTLATFFVFSYTKPGRNQSWLPRADLQALIKSTILFSTGDPSYGPIGLTLPRLLSLTAIIGICALGLWLFIQRRAQPSDDGESPRVLFLICAITIPWALAFGISQVRSIYHQKYLLFLMPPLFILFAWVLIRARAVKVAAALALFLVGITSSALFVFYTEPTGDQWREAIAYMRPAYQPGDLVVMSPGFYGHSFAYYFYDEFPDNILEVSRAPVGIVQDGEWWELDPSAQGGSGDAPDSAFASAERIWLLTGDSPAESSAVKRIEQNYTPVDTRAFLGARVRLLQRIDR
jgi:4-amino-4-deoxy-L-arabinose transferase-like glycosyltransferase